MTDLEISKALALAIGWMEYDLFQLLPRNWKRPIDKSQVKLNVSLGPEWGIREFDYRDPSVIWPIAERYNFPFRNIDGLWACDSENGFVTADTAAKAVAMAVIASR